jgi:hypothetical protein
LAFHRLCVVLLHHVCHSGTGSASASLVDQLTGRPTRCPCGPQPVQSIGVSSHTRRSRADVVAGHALAAVVSVAGGSAHRYGSCHGPNFSRKCRAREGNAPGPAISQQSHLDCQYTNKSRSRTTRLLKVWCNNLGTARKTLPDMRLKSAARTYPHLPAPQQSFDQAVSELGITS